jgi:hypothetical protein
MNLSDESDLINEVAQLLSYFEKRKLSEQEACAVMGIAMESLIADPTEARHFIHLLARRLHISDELRSGH